VRHNDLHSANIVLKTANEIVDFLYQMKQFKFIVHVNVAAHVPYVIDFGCSTNGIQTLPVADNVEKIIIKQNLMFFKSTREQKNQIEFLRMGVKGLTRYLESTKRPPSTPIANLAAVQAKSRTLVLDGNSFIYHIITECKLDICIARNGSAYWHFHKVVFFFYIDFHLCLGSKSMAPPFGNKQCDDTSCLL
jgi:hypothetical protein